MKNIYLSFENDQEKNIFSYNLYLLCGDIYNKLTREEKSINHEDLEKELKIASKLYDKIENSKTLSFYV